jgi:formate dehydrogenase maturation protein FdhE
MIWLALLTVAVLAVYWMLFRKQARHVLRTYTKALCPGCRSDLVSCPLTTCEDTDLVRYVCGGCDTKSEWLFDAPVPILIRHDAAAREARERAGL